MKLVLLSFVLIVSILLADSIFGLVGLFIGKSLVVHENSWCGYSECEETYREWLLLNGVLVIAILIYAFLSMLFIAPFIYSQTSEALPIATFKWCFIPLWALGVLQVVWTVHGLWLIYTTNLSICELDPNHRAFTFIVWLSVAGAVSRALYMLDVWHLSRPSTKKVGFASPWSSSLNEKLRA
jgi:hypothetical protein